MVCSACSKNGFYIPGNPDPVRACDPCYLKLQRENKFIVAEKILNSHDCHSDHSWPFNITKEQLVFTMNRLSTLLVSSDESTRYCTLCKEIFDLFHWKVFFQLLYYYSMFVKNVKDWYVRVVDPIIANIFMDVFFVIRA